MEVEMMRWRRRHPIDQNTRQRPDESLVLEAQCFLDGNYLEIAFSQGRDVPVWAWLSIVAHGDKDSLERASNWLSNHDGIRPELDMWGRVLEHIARQVQGTAQAVGCSLGEIQRGLLIPLELTIITTPVGPTTLYRLVTSMLAEMKMRIETE